jgi:hypothetical protein
MAAPVSWCEITPENPNRLDVCYRDLFGGVISESPDSTYELVDAAAREDAPEEHR